MGDEAAGVAGPRVLDPDQEGFGGQLDFRVELELAPGELDSN